MKENRIKRFNENSELNISDVSGSLLVPLKTIQDWIGSLESTEWDLNHQIGVREEMEDFLKNYKNNDH